MSGNLANYNFGGGGVNLVKDPLEMGDDEATQLQNAEYDADAATSGKGALQMRGGLVALNASPLAGTVLGLLGLAMDTTYTRTLYAARGTATANTWRTSVDGTTWGDVVTLLAAARIGDFTDNNGLRDARRIGAIRNLIVYPGDAYTVATDNPPLLVWDGTEGFTVAAIPVGPSATALTPAFAIVDSLVANGNLYLAIKDPGGTAPNLCGRVLQVDLQSGVIKQIANAFGNGTGEKAGGSPCCLAWYQNQLFVGLQGSNTTDAIGNIVRCFPTVDATWTTDVSTLSGYPCSLCVFNGDLYAGTESSVATGARVYKRAATTKAWTAQYTSAGGSGGTGFMTSLIEYASALYAFEYHSTAPTILIKRTTDGTTWTSDRDVAATDGGVAANYPGNAVLGGSSDLFVAYRSTTTTATDGFILRRVGGTWSKVDAARNLAGQLTLLVTRS